MATLPRLLQSLSSCASPLGGISGCHDLSTTAVSAQSSSHIFLPLSLPLPSVGTGVHSYSLSGSSLHTQLTACSCSPSPSSKGGVDRQSSSSVQGSFSFRRSEFFTSFRANLVKWAGRSDQENCRSLQVFAKGDDSMSSEMSVESALKLLGVSQGATFDEILRAKKLLVDSSGGDSEQVRQVERAYDMLLMQSLQERRAGKVVDSSVRYADVQKLKAGLASVGGGPDWLKGALKKVPVTVGAPSGSAIGTQTAIYGALIVWTFASASSTTGDISGSSAADVPGLILAIGFGASLYFLRKQNLKLGKATAITVGGLVAGAVLGGLVESWLRVDIVPVLGVGSPAVVVSEFVLVSLWLSSLYLR